MEITKEALKIMIYDLETKSKEVGFQNAKANIKTYDEHGNESYDDKANKGHFEMERYYGCLDSVSDSFKYFKMLSENIEAILMKFQDLPF